MSLRARYSRKVSRTHAAQMFGLSTKAFDELRSREEDFPRPFRFGEKARIRFDEHELMNWLEQHRVSNGGTANVA